MKKNLPASPEELEDYLSDPKKVQNTFSNKESITEFMNGYAEKFAKKDQGDVLKQTKAQTQAVVAEMLKAENGGKPPVNFSDKMTPGSETTKAVSLGRGAVYNKAAPGAQFESAYKQEQRFGSMGEMLAAIQEEARPSSRANRKDLLQKLEYVRSFQNSFGSEVPGDGGFLVPEIMRADLLQLALESAIVRSRATVIPMSTLRVPIPTVDETSHVSSLFGGVVFYWAEESSSLIESQGAFGRVVLDAKKLTGFFKVPNELLADAPAFGGWFDTRIPLGLAWQEDVSFMTGTGVGEPLGFISCPASVSVAKQTGQQTGTILWENIVGMYARMLPTSLGNAVWIAAIDTFPQLATMALSVGTGGGPVWIGNFSGGSGGADTPPMTILGRPVIFTEKVSALSTTGDINFVDLSYYLIGDRQTVSVASSDQYAFQNDQTAYRIIERVDGRPWLQSALTPHNNSSNTLTAFVQLATR